jgi:hypothetical protein
MKAFIFYDNLQRYRMGSNSPKLNREVGEIGVLLCPQSGEILARREDLDPLRALQLLQMSIARDEIVRPGFNRALEKHIVAGILADNLNTLRWENQEHAVGILK